MVVNFPHDLDYILTNDDEVSILFFFGNDIEFELI